MRARRLPPGTRRRRAALLAPPEAGRNPPQKIRREKFGSSYRRIFLWIFSGAVVITVSVLAGPLCALFRANAAHQIRSDRRSRQSHCRARIARQYLLRRPRQERFLPFRSKSVAIKLRDIKWVESASVQRILQNRIRVEITERNPIAFRSQRQRSRAYRWARRQPGSAHRS